MAKKSATYATYELRVEDNGKIVILNDGRLVQNAMGAIRNISADVNFTLDPKWNTQSSGRKLIDFLNSSASETTPATVSTPKSDAGPVPESEPTPTPASSPTKTLTSSPAPKPVAKPPQPKNDNELTEEEMNELLKQIAELRKTIEALEARIAKLEKAPATSPAAASGKREVITHHKYVGGDSYTDYYKTSEGRVLDAGYHWNGTIDRSNYLIELKKILIEIGEEDAVDLKDLTTEILKKADSARFEQFITQITRLATKYGSKGTIPALLPNDAVLSTSGQIRRTSVTKKAIKF